MSLKQELFLFLAIIINLPKAGMIYNNTGL